MISPDEELNAACRNPRRPLAHRRRHHLPFISTCGRSLYGRTAHKMSALTFRYRELEPTLALRYQ
jgi:hypothetical protein